MCIKKEFGQNMENIFEKTFIQIKGQKIGMFINGNHIDNPVLLFVHGGPGFPEYGLTQKYPTHLEEYFIVCWYDQRGGGLSYDKNIDTRQITVDNIISDTVEVANYLRNRFGKEKIYIMAHSWGTLIGLKTVYQHPGLFYAYIGVEQMSNQVESEKIAYEYMLEQYKKMNNKRMVKKLEKYRSLFNIMPLNYVELLNYAKHRDKPMHELGIGSMHEMRSVISGLFLPIMKNKNYTFSERINIWKAKNLCIFKTNLWETMHNTDLTKEINSVEIPIFFFHGIYDYTVNYKLAKEYYEQFVAPIKGFYTFFNSAHSPIFEEPGKVIKILLEDVLKNTENALTSLKLRLT